MIKLLLDTNLLIRSPDYSTLEVEESEVRVFTSTLCIAEVLEGEFSDDPVVAAAATLELHAAQTHVGDGIPFGSAEVAAYRAICAVVSRGPRSLTRARRIDMMIAATALANGLVLATRNIDDFVAVADIVPMVEL
ncbi:MAG: hypothetical protein FWF43_06535 [Propionibacteriaceae bacterium]|nr:hypothetical protein [Propionibacteriaceae bacterium]